MSEPGTSATEQQNQDEAGAADRARAKREFEALQPTIGPRTSGAVRGGEETKPGQMDGDEDVRPDAPQSTENRLHRK